MISFTYLCHVKEVHSQASQAPVLAGQEASWGILFGETWEGNATLRFL